MPLILIFLKKQKKFFFSRKNTFFPIIRLSQKKNQKWQKVPKKMAVLEKKFKRTFVHTFLHSIFLLLVRDSHFFIFFEKVLPLSTALFSKKQQKKRPNFLSKTRKNTFFHFF